MAVALDATSAGAGGTGNFNWTHTPVGTPKGVWVVIPQDTGQTDEVTAVTYGGVAMERVIAGSPTNPIFRDGVGGDDGGIYEYFLGSGIPTGAQTVAVTVNGAEEEMYVHWQHIYLYDTDPGWFTGVAVTDYTP
jgi:hypothetical protein